MAELMHLNIYSRGVVPELIPEIESLGLVGSGRLAWRQVKAWGEGVLPPLAEGDAVLSLLPIVGHWSREALRALLLRLMHYTRQYPLAVALRRGERQPPIRRIVSDLDGTLTAREGLVQLLAYGGGTSSDELERLTRSAMLGEEDFVESFTRRSELLKGLHRTEMQRAIASIPLAQGAERLGRLCRARGLSLEVATSAYELVAETLQASLAYARYTASGALWEGERFVGVAPDRLVDTSAKARFALEHPLSEETLTIGDGANDVDMLLSARQALLYCGLSLPEGRESLALDQLVLLLLND